MPDQVDTKPADQDAPPNQGDNQPGGAPEQQVPVDWKSEARKWEARAKANNDAAARLQALEDAQKTEAQKQAEALAAAQAKLAELETAKTVAEVAALKGVPADLLHGASREELEALADQLLAFKGQQPGPVVPNQKGAQRPTPQADWLRESIRR